MLNWCFFGVGNSTNVLRRGILTIRVMHRVLRQIESVPRPISERDG
jgi:hypothetical protein